MSQEASVNAVRAIYEDFVAGQIPAILDRLADDVVWVQPGETDLPWGGTSHGKAGVADFFNKLGGAASINQFEPRQYFGKDDQVVVLGSWSGTSRTKGRPFASDWVMTWKLRADKVERFEAFLDTSALAKQF